MRIVMIETEKKTIAENVAYLRKHRGFTLEQLAEKSGCTKSYIWEIENKPTIRPSADLVYRLAAVLNTTMEHLIGEAQHSDCDDVVVMRRFNKLSSENKIRLLKIMEVL